MRLLLLVLIIANVLAYGYIRFAASRVGSDCQIAGLQINRDKLKLVKPGTPLSLQSDGNACYEWGAFGAEDAGRAAAALAKLGLGATQRAAAADYWVYIPAFKDRAAANRTSFALNNAGVSDFFVIPDNRGGFAISLGIFRTEAAAADYLAQVKRKGVSLAVSGPREGKTSVFVVRDPGDANLTRLTALKAEFPSAEVRNAPCGEPALRN
jgi:hypothetical protein